MDSTGKAPTEANILEKINGGGNGMPSYKDVLSDAERKDLIAYLKTL
jgi:mono/diheme cytochrome c family protein